MAAAAQENLNPSWFEANPKKTIVLILVIFLVAATLITEKVLAYINHSQKMVLFTERRYINLREYQPFLDVVDISPRQGPAGGRRPGEKTLPGPHRRQWLYPALSPIRQARSEGDLSGRLHHRLHLRG